MALPRGLLEVGPLGQPVADELTDESVLLEPTRRKHPDEGEVDERFDHRGVEVRDRSRGFPVEATTEVGERCQRRLLGTVEQVPGHTQRLVQAPVP